MTTDALYLRVSPEGLKRDMDPDALEAAMRERARNQELQLRAMTEARGWTVPLDADAVYIDLEHGQDPARVAFNRLNHDVRVGRVRRLAFVSWDRVTRGGIKAAFDIMESWKRWGLRWESLSEPFLSAAQDGDPTAELLFAIIAWKAKQERLDIGRRTRAGMARVRTLTGKHMGRPKGAKDKRPRRIRSIAEAKAMVAENPGLDWNLAQQIVAYGVPASESTMDREVRAFAELQAQWAPVSPEKGLPPSRTDERPIANTARFLED